MSLVFDSKEDSDVTFIVDNEEIQAHQLLLINRSSVFKAMIKGPMAPADQRHQITDPKVSANDFNNFLKFLYTEKCEINHENVEVMLHLSHMYDVSALFEMCVTKLPEFFSTTRPLRYAEVGIHYDNKSDILVTCLNAFNPNTELQYLNNQNEVVLISSALAVEFVKRSQRTSALSEDVIFQKTFNWAKGICEAQQRVSNATNLKEIMAPLVRHLNLEKMDMKILTSTVYEYELIPEKRLLKHFCDHIIKKEPKKSSTSYSTSVSSAHYIDSRLFREISQIS